MQSWHDVPVWIGSRLFGNWFIIIWTNYGNSLSGYEFCLGSPDISCLYWSLWVDRMAFWSCWKQLMKSHHEKMALDGDKNVKHSLRHSLRHSLTQALKHSTRHNAQLESERERQRESQRERVREREREREREAERETPSAVPVFISFSSPCDLNWTCN